MYEEYNLVNNLIRVVHARLGITMHRLSPGMQEKELPMISIGIIAIMATPSA